MGHFLALFHRFLEYKVSEYNVNELNLINLIDTNPDVTSWSYDVRDFQDKNFLLKNESNEIRTNLNQKYSMH